jgi:hypothetical protein
MILEQPIPGVLDWQDPDNWIGVFAALLRSRTVSGLVALFVTATCPETFTLPVTDSGPLGELATVTVPETGIGWVFLTSTGRGGRGSACASPVIELANAIDMVMIPYEITLDAFIFIVLFLLSLC